MLQKSSKNFNVEKLRAIHLFETDFNALHKIIFNPRLMPTLETTNVIPQKIIGEKRS